MIYFILPMRDLAWLNGSVNIRVGRARMINQPTAHNQRIAQEREQAAGAWLGGLIDKVLDYIDERGESLGLPTTADDLYGQRMKAEAPLDRPGH